VWVASIFLIFFSWAFTAPISGTLIGNGLLADFRVGYLFGRTENTKEEQLVSLTAD